MKCYGTEMLSDVTKVTQLIKKWSLDPPGLSGSRVHWINNAEGRDIETTSFVS